MVIQIYFVWLLQNIRYVNFKENEFAVGTASLADAVCCWGGGEREGSISKRFILTDERTCFLFYQS